MACDQLPNVYTDAAAIETPYTVLFLHSLVLIPLAEIYADFCHQIGPNGCN